RWSGWRSNQASFERVEHRPPLVIASGLRPELRKLRSVTDLCERRPREGRQIGWNGAELLNKSPESSREYSSQNSSLPSRLHPGRGGRNRIRRFGRFDVVGIERRLECMPHHLPARLLCQFVQEIERVIVLERSSSPRAHLIPPARTARGPTAAWPSAAPGLC